MSESQEIDFPGEMGFRLTHVLAEEISKQKIISRALDWMPLGARVIVVKDPVPTKIGSLFLSEQQRDQQQMGTGWIISAGPRAGKYDLAPVGNIRVDDPGKLLGLHVMFGFHAGKVMRFSVFDNEYESEVLAVAPVDIWAVDMNPAGAEIVKEFEEMFAQTRAGEDQAAREVEEEAARKLEDDRAARIVANESEARAAALITGQREEN